MIFTLSELYWMSIKFTVTYMQIIYKNVEPTIVYTYKTEAQRQLTY